MGTGGGGAGGGAGGGDGSGAASGGGEPASGGSGPGVGSAGPVSGGTDPASGGGGALLGGSGPAVSPATPASAGTPGRFPASSGIPWKPAGPGAIRPDGAASGSPLDVLPSPLGVTVHEIAASAAPTSNRTGVLMASTRHQQPCQQYLQGFSGPAAAMVTVW